MFRLQRSLLLVLVLAGPLLVLAQKSPTADAIASAGVFSGQEYSTPVLGFSMLAPGGWKFYDAQQNKSAVDRNKQIAASKGDAKLITSAANTQVLFQAIPPSYGGQDRQAIISAGIETLTTPRTSERYATEQRDLAVASTQAKLTSDLRRSTYGGVEWWTYDIEGPSSRGPYRQRCMITVRRGVAIFLVVTYFDDRQQQIVDGSLKSIKFK